MASRRRGHRWWRDPLVHFAILGAGLFALHRWLAPPSATRQIRVSEAVLRGLQDEHNRRTGTIPTAEEERALVERYVSNEILYREALAQGLDRGDIIVRRRLVQKMQFLLENLEAPAEPTDAELQTFLDGHRDRYRVPERMSFTHIYLSTDRHGAETATLLAALRARIDAGEDPATLGDPFLHGTTFTQRTASEITNLFGADFVRSLAAVTPENWSGPVASSFGLHLVRVTQREPSRDARLDEVRAAVHRDWEEQRRSDAQQAALQRLREQYRVEIDRLPAERMAARP
jgi:peptidyl-prolyl cis-trans isomerase C